MVKHTSIQFPATKNKEFSQHFYFSIQLPHWIKEGSFYWHAPIPSRPWKTWSLSSSFQFTLQLANNSEFLSTYSSEPQLISPVPSSAFLHSHNFFQGLKTSKLCSFSGPLHRLLSLLRMFYSVLFCPYFHGYFLILALYSFLGNAYLTPPLTSI